MKAMVHYLDEKLSIFIIFNINEIVNIQKKTNGSRILLLGIT
jgi:hypothetical protein